MASCVLKHGAGTRHPHSAKPGRKQCPMPSIRHAQDNAASAANGSNLPAPDARGAQPPSASAASSAADLHLGELDRASNRLADSTKVRPGADGPSDARAQADQSVASVFDDLYQPRRRPTQLVSILFAFPSVVDSSILISVAHCATTTLDDHSRLSDRSAIGILGWAAGQSISFDSDHRSSKARAAGQSRWSVGRSGALPQRPADHRTPLRLPHSTRQTAPGRGTATPSIDPLGAPHHPHLRRTRIRRSCRPLMDPLTR